MFFLPLLKASLGARVSQLGSAPRTLIGSFRHLCLHKGLLSTRATLGKSRGRGRCTCLVLFYQNRKDRRQRIRQARLTFVQGYRHFAIELNLPPSIPLLSLGPVSLGLPNQLRRRLLILILISLLPRTPSTGLTFSPFSIPIRIPATDTPQSSGAAHRRQSSFVKRQPLKLPPLGSQRISADPRTSVLLTLLDHGR